MDVTPHDLRNAELREAFRGYRPEEVEELLERVQADYRGRLRAILEKELADLDRRAVLPPGARPEIHEIDLSGLPEAPSRASAPVDPEVAEPEVAEPEEEPELPAARAVPPLGGSSVFARPSDRDSGPPTEALVVLDEELADTGPSGGSARRRA